MSLNTFTFFRFVYVGRAFQGKLRRGVVLVAKQDFSLNQ